MKLRTIFFIGLALWWGGALIATVIGSLLLKEIAVNIIGGLTCLLGLFLLARWGWRKLVGRGAPITSHAKAPFGRGMGIYSMTSVPEEARDPIERAIQADAFKPKGKTGDGAELLFIQTPSQDWLVVVEVTDAIMIRAAYKTTADTVDQQATDYLLA